MILMAMLEIDLKMPMMMKSLLYHRHGVDFAINYTKLYEIVFTKVKNNLNTYGH